MGLRHFIHRLSLCASVAFLCAIPMGIVVEVREWGRMPEDFMSGFFAYAILSAIVNHMTRPQSQVNPPAPIADHKPESN